MPDGSYSGFNTLEREQRFRSPPKKGHSVPILTEFVAPHIESFNALFDDSGLPSGDGDGRGQLSLSLQDIGERTIFDYSGEKDAQGNAGLGNRLSGMFSFRTVTQFTLTLSIVWIDSVAIARPMVPEKDTTVLERRVFPSEVL